MPAATSPRTATRNALAIVASPEVALLEVAGTSALTVRTLDAGACALRRSECEEHGDDDRDLGQGGRNRRPVPHEATAGRERDETVLRPPARSPTPHPP